MKFNIKLDSSENVGGRVIIIGRTDGPSSGGRAVATRLLPANLLRPPAGEAGAQTNRSIPACPAGRPGAASPTKSRHSSMLKSVARGVSLLSANLSAGGDLPYSTQSYNPLQSAIQIISWILKAFGMRFLVLIAK